MRKNAHKIVLFIEPNDNAFYEPLKIGHLFINRFAIDEEAGFEIINVLELEKTSVDISYRKNAEYKNHVNERMIKGMGLWATILPKAAQLLTGLGLTLIGKFLANQRFGIFGEIALGDGSKNPP